MKTEREISDKIRNLINDLLEENSGFAEQNILGQIRALNWVIEKMKK